MSIEFRKTFLAMNTKSAYNLIAAVRGPDEAWDGLAGRAMDGLEIKKLLTARIRAIIFTSKGRRRLGLMHISSNTPRFRGHPRVRVGVQTAKFSKADYTSLQLLLFENTMNQHFVAHLRMAVNSSERHPIWGGFGPRISRALVV